MASSSSSIFGSSPTQSKAPTGGFSLSLADLPQDDGDKHSIISSRMTDINSEFGDEIDQVPGLTSPPGSNRNSALSSLHPPTLGRPNTRISIGDPQAEAALTTRPSTATSMTTSKWGARPRSRGAMTPVGGSFRSSNRPPSAASRTHVPSITSHAFYNPMSSTKLSAQRGKVSEEGDRPSMSEITSAPLPAITPSTEHATASPLKSVTTGLIGQPRTSYAQTPHSLDNPFGFQSPAVIHHGNSNRTSLQAPSEMDESNHYRYSLGRQATGSPTNQTITSASPLRQGSRRSNTNEAVAGPAKEEQREASQGSATSHRAEVPVYAGKNYQYFPGNTLFCFGGRWQTARDAPINVLTATLVVVPSGLFFGFSAPWLWLNVHPALPVTFGYIFLVCMSSFIRASVTDPGIFPRNIHPLEYEEGEDPLAVGPPETGWTMIKPNMRRGSQPLEVPVKYCKTCRIWRPPRCHHCRNDASFLDALKTWRVPFAMVIYGALGSLYPIALVGYHVFLVYRGESTREYLNNHKFVPSERHRPFTRSNPVANFIAVLCRPRPPTYVQFKNKHVVGDQRFDAKEKLKMRSPVIDQTPAIGTNPESDRGRSRGISDATGMTGISNEGAAVAAATGPEASTSNVGVGKKMLAS
ncbi:Eukaryotic peptide chain release factor GTP-binding subunit [Orbilia oligospora]|uniref:protein S-acyltransferase n=1 Tax=Orbilia oligospora TaxID=2813651 RepID=A0A7C8JEV5_ORBOL|nr:Eukaryotic peptide chain release factor GTP-binding subunit [Orbilia oligospora]